MGEDRYATQDAAQDKVTVQEAARRLGVKEDAIRKRIQRGSIRHEKAEDGRVYVWVDATQDTGRATHDTTQDAAQDERFEGLGEQIGYLRRQLDEEREARRRADTIIAQLARANEEQARTIRELEAPAEMPPDESPPAETPDEGERAPPDEVVGATFGTVLLLTAGTGVAAGVANPLLIAQTDNALWLVVSLLWTVPPIFGLWLGRHASLAVADASAEIETHRKRLETYRKKLETQEKDATSQESAGREVFEQHAISAARDLRWFNRRLTAMQSLPPLIAVILGIVTVLSSLVTFWFGIGLVQTLIPLREVVGVAIAQGVVAGMFVLFASLIGTGFARQRIEAAHQGAGGGVTAKPSTGNLQALVGLVGTVITAILGFIAVLVQVFYGGGGGG